MLVLETEGHTWCRFVPKIFMWKGKILRYLVNAV